MTVDAFLHVSARRGGQTHFDRLESPLGRHSCGHACGACMAIGVSGARDRSDLQFLVSTIIWQTTPPARPFVSRAKRNGMTVGAMFKILTRLTHLSHISLHLRLI